MTARRVVRATLAAAATAVLAAASSCSGGAAPNLPSPSGRSTLVWYVGSTDQDQEDYARILADEFEEAYPPIKVEVRHTPKNTDQSRETLIQALRPGAQNPPDVYLGDVIWPAEFASNGRALPLDNQFDPGFWRRFERADVAAVTYRGRVYAAPFFADQGMLFYWKDLVPTPPKTWEDLVRDAKTLIRNRRVRYGYVWHGAAYEGLTCIWTEVLADAGGSTLTIDDTRSAINSPAALTALEFLHGLVADGISPPEVTSFEESDAKLLFASRQAAFLRGWNVAYSRFVAPDNPLRAEVGVAPLPSFAGRVGPGYSAVGGWGLYINPHTHQLDEAKEFIRWMTDIQAQLQLARLSHIPANAAVRGGDTARTNPAVATGLHAGRVRRQVYRPSNTPRYPAISKAVYESLNAALGGSLSPEAALRRAQEEINQALR